MDLLKENSTANICLFFTKLSWYLFLILSLFMPVVLLLAYIRKLPQWLDFQISVPVNPTEVDPGSNIDQSAISIDSAKAQLDVSYLAQHFPDLYLSLSLFGLIILGMIILGLYQLKGLLQDTINDAVFIPENIKRIKIIAALIFSYDPLTWIFHNFFFNTLFSETSANHLEIMLSSPTFNYWFIGLLIYILAAVFEKGHEMYLELKLTV